MGDWNNVTREELTERVVSAVLAELAASSLPSGAQLPAPRAAEVPWMNIAPGAPSSPAPRAAEAPPQAAGGRIGIGRSGARLRTRDWLAFRADHAAARDAAFLDVDPALLESLALPATVTRCRDKDEFLTRPDLGRTFPDESLAQIRAWNPKPCDALVYAADGLSSRAVEANLPDLLPMLRDGLTAQGLTMGQSFFVKYGRVAAMDAVAEATGAKVVCVLLGERPGLGSPESMSAYIAYGAKVGMPEAYRTVVSNIYCGGIPAVEAGAYLAELIAVIHREQASGVNRKG
ncbi:MAG: ethanolamine ammonia-lyase subunit EutC [Oscillospiraceae bacterium]|nr:ethanolamine ammonia-lyase subunit EutC [Oscillospiraceae bacterium]